MKTRLVIVGAVAALVLGLGAGIGFGEDEPAEPAPMSEAEMWAKMNQLAQPSKMHAEVLAKMVGTWNTKGIAFTGMGPTPFTGKSEHTSILDGRFVQVHYEGPFMGQNFEGAGLIGYDNLEEEFQQTWVMTMSSNMDYMKGSWDAEKKTLTWRGSMKMPNGVTYQKRSTATFEEDDKFTTTSYSTGSDGKEHKEMEMTYTRAEEAAE